MNSKRDLFLVRFACRKRWLTVEQGEECLALSRHLGTTRSVEEILRLQGYLGPRQLAELSAAADRTARRRGVSSMVDRRPTDPRRTPSGWARSPARARVDPASLPSFPVEPTLPVDRPPTERNKTSGLELCDADASGSAAGRIAHDRTVHDIDRIAPDWAATRTQDVPEIPRVRARRMPERLRFDRLERSSTGIPSTAGGPVERRVEVPRPSFPSALDGPGTLDRAQGGTGRAGPDGIGVPEELLGPFGRYELEAVLVRGSTSVVYRARLRGGAGPVALRVLDLDPASAARYVSDRAEGLISAARLDHPRVVRLLDVGRVRGRHYLATELVEGWTLEELLGTDGAPSGEGVLTILVDVADGLVAAHRVGLAHGAFGPSRVLVERGPRARLFGFGFAASPDPASDARAFVEVAGVLLAGAPASFASWIAEHRSASFPDLHRMLVELHALRRRSVRWTGSADKVGPSPIVARAVVLAAGWATLSALAHHFVVPASWVVHSAFVGALGMVIATVLLGAIGLIRRGEFPLPLSAAWLVRLEEAAGVVGSAVVTGGLGLVPLAGIHVAAALPAGLCLLSRTFGVLLRRRVASHRADRGRGRMLAVLADPLLSGWRTGHTPWMVLASVLALTRFGLLAYFSAG